MYFNPRSHEESDTKMDYKFSMIPNFNPRSHEESDGYLLFDGDPRTIISIHALTKRATRANKYIGANLKFQSTLSRRERHDSIVAVGGGPIFQSTLSRRERLFNPADLKEISKISIHALTKRATAIYSILWLNFYLEVLVILIVLHF